MPQPCPKPEVDTVRAWREARALVRQYCGSLTLGRSLMRVSRPGFMALVAGLALTLGCVRVPEHIKPVGSFETNRYLGKWYEIARLDHTFERGLTKVTATYSLREDGGLRVVNQGYSPEKGIWKTATGKAFFVQDPDQGYLKVSFFGPFYGSYIIFELDREGYQYALVAGPDKSFLWLLARTPRLDPARQQELVNRAKVLGFDTGKLIFVAQD